MTGGHRVVVTGMGAVSAAGDSLDELWAALVRPDDQPVPDGAIEVDASPWMRARDLRRTSRATHYAVVAAGRAWDAAGIDPDRWRTGIVLGNVYGAPDLMADAEAALAAEGPAAVPVHLAAQACENAPAAMVAIVHGIHGPTKAVATACASGGHAIGDAADLIRLGRCDVVLAGASQGPMNDALAASYHAMRIVSPTGLVRPFDARRDGSRFSEGAGVLVLERLDHARQRGATVLAEVVGHGNTSDAENKMAGSPEAMARCIADALADGGLAAADLAAVFAHGTATIVNDRVESAVLAEVLGGRAVPVTSIKRVLGHGVAVAGAWNAIAAVLAFARRSLPQAGSAIERDADVALDVVSGEPRDWTPGPVLSNAFGLGGTNSAVVLAPPPEDTDR